MTLLGKIRLHDYRCFRREAPATLELHTGFTSFVGPNNAGKSTLLRSLHELRPVFETMTSVPGNPAAFLQGAVAWNPLPPMLEHQDIVCERDDPRCSIELEPVVEEADLSNAVVRASVSAVVGSNSLKLRLFDNAFLEVGSPTSQIVSMSPPQFELSDGRVLSLSPLAKLIELLRDVQYFGPFRNAINTGAGSYFDLQLGTGFINQWHRWKTGSNKSQNRAIGRVTEDVRRLIGARTLEITASTELGTLQVSVDGKPHKLPELGAGFAQLVVVLGNALVQKPSMIIIDEPELNLHPGLQSDFLTTLGSYTKLGTVLFATHSIGLARASADRCFTVQKKELGSIVRPFERTPSYAEFLGSLGIAGLQEVGWDRILLVEGPTDVRTFQYLLRLYDKERRTVVLPLGGDSMANGKTADQLSEVVRLGGKVIAIVDSERASESDGPISARREFAKVCTGLKVPCCLTERRATENYFSQRAIDQAFQGRQFKALGAFEKPSAAGRFWGKGDNWRVAACATLEEVADTDIGKFLEEL